MQELIQKLEKATEGSEELNAAIALATGWEKRPTHLMDWWRKAGGEWLMAPPRFSESLDAALTLVPEGMEWEATNLYGIARAGVGINADDGPFYGTSEFGSVPVALCIAALRARHSQSSDDKASDLANGAETA